MLINEMFDTVVFLCAVMVVAFITMGLIHLFYKYILGVDLNSTY